MCLIEITNAICGNTFTPSVRLGIESSGDDTVQCNLLYGLLVVLGASFEGYNEYQGKDFHMALSESLKG